MKTYYYMLLVPDEYYGLEPGTILEYKRKLKNTLGYIYVLTDGSQVKPICPCHKKKKPPVTFDRNFYIYRKDLFLLGSA
jgi:hypothetical protein